MRKFYTFVLIILLAQTALAERLTGIVIDGFTREPLIGVTILNKDDGTGTVTDMDGRFAIDLKQLPAHVQFSYVGYQTDTRVIRTIPAKYEVLLQANNEVLDEVVVTAADLSRR